MNPAAAAAAAATTSLVTSRCDGNASLLQTFADVRARPLVLSIHSPERLAIGLLAICTRQPQEGKAVVAKSAFNVPAADRAEKANNSDVGKHHCLLF